MTHRIALITGANQGIGYALVEELAARWTPNDLVLLTGRNAERVELAAARAKSAAGARVEGRQLDVSDAAAVARMAAELGAADVVISNAGSRLTPDRQEEQADEFISVANGGAHAVLRSFGPILRPGGRLVVIAGTFGVLGNLDERLHPLFGDDTTLDDVEAAVESWRTAIHDGTAQERGWPDWINMPSKIAQVAAVRAVARERRDVLIAAVCPGLVDTPASRPWFRDFSRALTPAQSAAAVLDFVLAPADPAFHGQLVRDGEVVPWHQRTHRAVYELLEAVAGSRS